MEVYSGASAYKQLHKNLVLKIARVPNKESENFIEGGIFPALNPKFKIKNGSKIFTIGSCFARHVEDVLVKRGYEVPVSKFTLPEGEIRFPGPHILNEYNAGTLYQRVANLIGEFDYSSEKGIERTEIGDLDLFLHVLNQPVKAQRILERREEINELYQNIRDSNLVILTLGLIECWYDSILGCYLNKAPSKKLVSETGERYEFHRLSVEDVMSKLSFVTKTILELGAEKILLTVSPVPLEATFSEDNCVMANSYSKAVLRVVAKELMNSSSDIDYFPSYEIVTSYGSNAFGNDNIHVLGGVVYKVTNYMVDNYEE